jgi:hypothetical protein
MGGKKRSMATFVVRIALRHADWHDYVNLHEAMESVGFNRTILGDDGRRFHLPDAEYCVQGTSLKQDQIHALAKNAASTINRPFSLVVVEAGLITFEGLEPVQQPWQLGLMNIQRYG